jgi:hypothetical protein
MRQLINSGAMMLSMNRRTPGFLAMLLVLAVLSPAQTPEPSRYLEIQLPPGVRSETFFIRYSLTGVNFSSWAPPRTGVTSYLIHTTANGRLASGIKAVLYAPGCAIRTLDLAVTAFDNPRYSFVCQPLRTVEIHGYLSRTHEPPGKYLPRAGSVAFQARYVARWAQAFLGVDDTINTSFPVGTRAEIDSDGSFTLAIPDFSQDPLAGDRGHPGELQILAKLKDASVPYAQLIPVKLPTTKFGGFPIQKEYPARIEFQRLGARCSPLHDSEGFAIRTDFWDACAL